MVRRGSIALVLLAAACGEGLPFPERIASTRPLAMRVEVLETDPDPAAPVRAEALPLEAVRVVPFIADEDGPLSLEEIETQLEPVWISCSLQPIEGLFSCLTNNLPLERDDIPDCPPVDLGSIDPSIGELPESVSPCFVTGGTPATPQLEIPLDPLFLLGGDIELTMVAHTPGSNRSTRECLDRLLSEDADLSTDCLYVTQRVAVGPDTAIRQLAEDLGFAEAGELGPIPDEPAEPDTHPRIERFSVQVFDENDTNVAARDVMPGDTIEVEVGHRVELETAAPEGDLQTYLIERDMDQLVERDELYTGQWFITWGKLLSPTSDDPVSINTWELEEGGQDESETPPGNRATMIYVLRDDRQGVDWWWFHLDFVP